MNFFKKTSLILFLILWLLIGFVYGNLLENGRQVYESRSNEVNKLISNHPDFFDATFNQIFESTLECDLTPSECKENTRHTFANYLNSSNQLDLINQPIYFIKLLPDRKIAKLFFSGDLIIEAVNTRNERRVGDLLKGERSELYGPYFGSEVFKIGQKGERQFYDPKPRYLKDLYSQMEVIVPYENDNQISGAIVYLHGQ